MLIRVLEVAGVSTPESIASGLRDDGARFLRLIHHRVDFGFGSDVVPDAELGRAPAPHRHSDVVREARPRPERELQAGLELEERDGAVLELRADNAFGLQSEAVTVKANRSFEIVDAQGQERYPRLHGTLHRA